MANFDEIKKNAAEKAEIFAGKAADFARTAAEKAKVMAKIGKLNAEILAEKESVRKASTELGKLYYEYFRVDPHEPMKELCARITEAYALIEAKQAEIAELKGETGEYDEEGFDAEEAGEEPKELPDGSADECGCGEQPDSKEE